MPDRARPAVRVAVEARERPTEQPVRLALAVDVGGENGANAVARSHERLEAVLVDRLAEVHEAPAAPGSDRHPAEVHRAGAHRRAGAPN